MNTLHKHIERLNTTNSKLDKQEILIDIWNTAEEKLEFFYYLNKTYDKTITFGVKSIAGYNYGLSVTDIQCASFDTMLTELESRCLTGTRALNAIDFFAQQLGEASWDGFYRRVLLRTMDCGISAKSINKALKTIGKTDKTALTYLIPEIPYQRCSKLDKKTENNISFPAIIQKKSDGQFVYVIVGDNNVTYMTRNGQSFDLPLKLNLTNASNVVLMGEMLLVDGTGRELDRKIGNGKLNAAIKYNNAKSTSLTEDEYNNILKAIRIDVWDIVPTEAWRAGEYDVPYVDRLAILEYDIDPENMHDSNVLRVIETQTVDSMEEALTISSNYMNQEFEGAILKDNSVIWKNHTSPKMLKMKAILDCDLIVTGCEYGKAESKYHDKIGSLICESFCGRLKVNVGSGLTDADRDLPFSDYIGKVVEVQYNEKIKSKSKDTHSLFLPIFQEIRHDKDKVDADTLEWIQ